MRRPRTAPHPVWNLWWTLKKVFSLWSAPATWFATPGSWSYFGNDFVTGLRRNSSTDRAFALLDAAPAYYDAVHKLAVLNARRHEQMFQFIALLYVSIPVTILLGLAEIMPEGVVEMFRQNTFDVWFLAGLLTLGTGVYMVGVWRARQLVSVIELWGLERRATAA